LDVDARLLDRLESAFSHYFPSHQGKAGPPRRRAPGVSPLVILNLTRRWLPGRRRHASIDRRQGKRRGGRGQTAAPIAAPFPLHRCGAGRMLWL